ncbi:MAG: hypothetical protein J5993_00280 [Clostridia bacterium]|nr:hypothetical protein [Clostridia bacterium]
MSYSNEKRADSIETDALMAFAILDCGKLSIAHFVDFVKKGIIFASKNKGEYNGLR